jgi:hypothetical protein
MATPVRVQMLGYRDTLYATPLSDQDFLATTRLSLPRSISVSSGIAIYPPGAASQEKPVGRFDPVSRSTASANDTAIPRTQRNSARRVKQFPNSLVPNEIAFQASSIHKR